MYQIVKQYIKPESRLSDIILNNYFQLLLLEHFDLNYETFNKTVAAVCSENGISVAVFLLFANLYNGFQPESIEEIQRDDIPAIIGFLKKSHKYYEKEKYPAIRGLIEQLSSYNDSKEILLIEEFFDEYFEEVKDHLSYEDEIVFPYFKELLAGEFQSADTFSVKEYSEHHTDIESKLVDLKELLLHHIPIQRDLTLRRRILYALRELEEDINIHALIEDNILVPLIDDLEKKSGR